MINVGAVIETTINQPYSNLKGLFYDPGILQFVCDSQAVFLIQLCVIQNVWVLLHLLTQMV
jgi:hypothetical protein